MPHISFVPVPLLEAAIADPRLSIEAVWDMQSTDPFFGGLSAVAVLADGRLMAFSDRGTGVRFTPPDLGPPQEEYADYRFPLMMEDSYPDIESALVDRETGELWLGFESSNSIWRFDAAGAFGGLAIPPTMHHWPENSGAEAMAFLPDGQLLVIREDASEALLFPHDPTRQSSEARLILPPDLDGFAVTDMALMPDGRLLILARSMAMGLPPFATRLYLADAPVPQQEWIWQEVEGIAPALPVENYEGIAAAPRDDGALDIWLVADDNMAGLQRSLLVKLRWENPAPEAKSES